MRIESVQIKNFKSYVNSSTLELRSGFNVIVGENNAGKSSLMEALGTGFGSKPHLSSATVAYPGAFHSQDSAVTIELTLFKQDVADVLLRPGNLFLAQPSAISGDKGYYSQDKASADGLMQYLLDQDAISLKATVIPGKELASTRYPLHGLYNGATAGPSWPGITYTVEDDRVAAFKGFINFSPPTNEASHALFHHARSLIYSFSSERINLGQHTVGENRDLLGNASNLPEVLGNLQANRAAFLRFNQAVSSVLPQVKWISVRNIPGSRVEILVWSEDPSGEREDLARPLGECGTGIGQVLAMLYVALNSRRPRAILIDEPQSFLHPGAIRRLIDVLKEHPEHQYVVTTHSPTVITASNPATLTLVHQDGVVSDFRSIDPRSNDHLREYLAEIGARLSDVFGADSILWVEGPTEELSFPKILEGVAKRSLLGTAIIAVRSTGDLEGRHAEAIFDIYDRLSSAPGLLPPALGFIFDDEGKSGRQKDDILRRGKERVRFLPRRLYENYLLDPDAIAEVVNKLENFREAPVTADEISLWFETHRDEPKFLLDPNAVGDDWKIMIHGAKLLSALFSEMSEGRHPYQKTQHSVDITDWLIRNKPEALQEIANLLQGVLTEDRN